MDSTKRSCWVFPDNTIDPTANIMDNAWFALRVIWYEVSSAGALTLRNTSSFGSKFFYTADRAKLVRQNSEQAFVNVSCGDPAYMDTLCSDSTKRAAAITALMNFCRDNDFTGVDIDFEGFGQWTAIQYTNYKTFLTELGNALHAEGFLLSVEVPPIWNNTTSASSNEWTSRNSQGHYQLKYEDFNALPVDIITIMAYDYQYDMSAGTPNQPLAWLGDILKWARDKVNDKKKIVAGLPSHGYFGTTNGYSITNSTYEVMRTKPGFSTAARNAASGELIWASGGISYALCDDEAVDKKVAVCEEFEVGEYVLWHVGNNQYGGGKAEA